MRILLLENHSVFAETVARLFLAEHEVVVVPTLSEARRALRTQTFEAVLADYDLDDGKADVLVRELREAGFKQRIIAISGRDAGNEALRAAGANAVCSKLRFHAIREILS
jgi:DNA-binding response OmpR family regulator